jgi:rare lipoprotein A
MKIILALTLTVMLAACSTVPKTAGTGPRDGCEYLDAGLASWYGNEMAIGKRNGEYIFNPTASGEKFVPSGITAAHRTLPFGTMVRVVLDKKGADPHGIMVRINDRGPFVRGRIIDLSRGASKALGMPDTQPVILYICRE